MKTIQGLVVLFLWSTVSLLAQRTIHVPADQPTIQAGINAANNGDTVLVSPGTYTENIDFKGKAITVSSGATTATDAGSTIIQGATNGSIVMFQTNELVSAVLNGFTIQNAFGDQRLNLNSDGIDIVGASPTISNNVITRNIGCGIVLTGPASPLIKSNVISLNRTPILPELERAYCGGSSYAGTAIAIVSADRPQIVENLIENNSCYDQSNTGSGVLGCGVVINGGNEVLLESNTIRNNGESLFAEAVGGSYFLTTKIVLIQNLIYNDGNAVEENDIYSAFTSMPTPANAPTFIATNNTFYNLNFSLGPAFQPSETDNNLFVQTYFGPTGNPLNPYTLLSCGAYYTTPIDYMTTRNNDLYAGGYPQTNYPCPLTANNIDADPQFLNNDLSTPATWDFRVQRTSPVIAAGNITAPMIPATDLDGKNRTVCGTIDIGAYQKHPIPPITLTSSPNPSVGGTSVTFQAHVQGNCNTPTGVLTFLDGQLPIGTATLDATGNASISTATLFVGSHTITATYPGDFNFDSSTSNTVQQVVTGAPTSTSLQVIPNPAQAFQPITFTANVASILGVPTGTVSFLSRGQILSTVSVNASGIAVATISTLGAGTYQITAVYNASVNYQGSTSAPVSLVVNGATTTTSLSSAPNPSSFGQLVTFTAIVSASQSAVSPTGTVAFREGATVLGSDALSSSGVATLNLSTLAVGSHTIAAYYGSSPNDNASISNSIIQIVNPAQATVSLTGTPNPAAVGQTVTLLATISTANGLPTSGTVTFSDQFGTIGSAPISAGQATLQTSTLPSGTHNIIASFSGAGGFGGANSQVLVEVTQSFDFSISLSPATLSLASGTSGHVTVQVTGVGNLSGNVALKAAQIPDYGSVSFDPTAVQFTPAGMGSSVLSINTAQLPQHALLEKPTHGDGNASELLLAGFAALPLILMGRRKRYRQKLPVLPCALFTAIALTALSGCTNIYYPLNRIAPGTYSIPITGVDQASGITHTTTLTLTVTP